MVRVGVDIGGTFTDLCLAGDVGILAVGKALTTPEEPSRAVETVLVETLERAGVAIEDVAGLVHGTTLVTNAIIERKGARTGAAHDARLPRRVEIAREHRYELYDLSLELPDAARAAPPALRGRRARRSPTAPSLRPLDETHVARLVARAARHGRRGGRGLLPAQLHAIPRTSSGARAIVGEARRACACRCRPRSCPEIREYERTSTTVANVYVQALVERYLQRARAAARASWASRGQLLRDAVQRRHRDGRDRRAVPGAPARVGTGRGRAGRGAYYGQRPACADLISFDMGGTTAKLCVIEDGEPLIARRVRGRPRVPLQEGQRPADQGAGGRHDRDRRRRRLDRAGRQRSACSRSARTRAGADPGPACYGRGGTEPTVTDADLVLGYLDPDYFLGGRMTARPRRGAARRSRRTSASRSA